MVSEYSRDDNDEIHNYEYASIQTRYEMWVLTSFLGAISHNCDKWFAKALKVNASKYGRGLVSKCFINVFVHFIAKREHFQQSYCDCVVVFDSSFNNARKILMS